MATIAEVNRSQFKIRQFKLLAYIPNFNPTHLKAKHDEFTHQQVMCNSMREKQLSRISEIGSQTLA